MAINSVDGTYALEVWRDPDSEDDPDQNEYSERIDELRERAMVLMRGGVYRYGNLCRWNADTEEWDILEVFTEDDVK